MNQPENYPHAPSFWRRPGGMALVTAPAHHLAAKQVNDRRQIQPPSTVAM